MSDITITEKTKISEILHVSGRLRYILQFSYQIPLDEIISIRVDGDNFKLDISTADDMFRFKAKGLENVLMRNPTSDVLEMTFDPALAQGIYEIVDEQS